VLQLLWDKEREERGLTKKQTFVDLGCGNGLLVYLLTSEGYTGKGIDLRRRKIWGYYGDRANLEVCSLTPSDLTVFPQFDWLIGNHSDELTPWIPLMAARSSYQTRYFVLPCCPHDFDSKFRRPNTTKSQYSSYLDYIRLIGETVGFRVQEDTLRIPSSKRVCQVGQRRWYAEEDEGEMEKKRAGFLRERCRSGLPRQSGGEGGDGEGVVTEGEGVVNVRSETSKSTKQVSSVAGGRCEGSGWSERFVPRSATDQTRNCLHVDRSLQEFIVQTLSSHLLETENWIAIPTTPAVISSSTPTFTASSTTNIPSPATALHSSTNTVPSHCSLIISSHPSAASSTSESLTTSTSGPVNNPTITNPTITNSTNSVSTIKSVLTSLPTLTTGPLGSPANPLTVSESNPLPAALPILTTAAEKTPGDNVVGDTHTDAALSSLTAALSSKSDSPAPNMCQLHRKTPCDGSSCLPHTPKTTSNTCENNCDDVILINDVDDVVWNPGNHDDAARQKKLGMEGEGREVAATGGKDEARLTCEASRGNQTLWNLGGRLGISDAARLFDDAVLRQLKQECGGLQTLLRNHHQVFAVCRGFVQLRNWAVAGPEHGPRRPAKRRSAEDAKRLVKTKPCWFHHNHPQGCPRQFLEDSSCPYAHSSGDLRQRPDFSSTSEPVVTFPTL
ncbi:Probable tRNA (uracil-O(2)-)-methyltransferase, partial [Geodia barretti]